jgi:hypothetical protein
MDVRLVDGTYELFRHFYAVPAAGDANGQEIGAVRSDGDPERMPPDPSR